MTTAEAKEKQFQDLESSSDSSLGDYKKKLQPSPPDKDSSPLPADTPIGGRRRKLGDPSSFQ